MSRSSHRKATRIPVQWDIRATVEEVRFNGQALDISSSGVFMQTPVTPNLLDEVVVAWTLPTGEVVECPAWVRWVGVSATHGCQGVGLQFTRDVPEMDTWYAEECGRHLRAMAESGIGEMLD